MVDEKWGGVVQESVWYYVEIWMNQMRERDPNFVEDPNEEPKVVNWYYYQGVEVSKWNGIFDESLTEEVMGGVYNDVESKTKYIVFEDPGNDEEGGEQFEYVNQPMRRQTRLCRRWESKLMMQWVGELCRMEIMTMKVLLMSL